MQLGRAAVERGLGVRDGFELLVVDADRGRGAARRLGVVGGHDRDRLSLVAHVLEGEHGLVGVLEAERLAARDVLVRQHCEDAGQGERAGEVKAAHARPRVRAAQRRAPEHPVGAQVAGVRELALDLGDAVAAQHALADATARDRARCLAHAAPLTMSRRSRGDQLASSTSGLPPTRSVSTGRGGPSTSAATGSSMPACAEVVEPPQGDVGDLPGSSEPSSASRPRQRAPSIVPSASACARGERRAGRRAGARREQRLAQLDAAARRPRSRRRRRRRARPARRRRRGRGTGAMPAPSRAFELGQCATPVPVSPKRPTSRSLRWTQWASQTSAPSQPSSLEVLDRAAAEPLDAERLLLDRLGEVGVQPDAAAAGQLGRLAHQLRR